MDYLKEIEERYGAEASRVSKQVLNLNSRLARLEKIEERYGAEASRVSKQVLNLNSRLARLENRKLFVLRCRHSNLSPSHIKNGSKNIKILLADARGPLQRRFGHFEWF
ncbi:hypothetical protein QE152_g10982 [Popillia japonica]|uniref:Uncharacterized protein n=1 Tax=Popillia japonica TaxID=7064 RepID=A0AAW1LTV0_POPJA